MNAAPQTSGSASLEAARAGAATLAAVWRRSARVFAQRTALIAGERRLTYAELDARVARLAGALRAAGLERGDRIAVLAHPCPEFVECYLAAARIGVCVVALNTRLHASEIAYCLGLGRPARTFCSPSLRDLLPAELDTCPFGDAYEALLTHGDAGADLGPGPEPETIHNVLFTSGTTGRPKGAMISQRAAASRALRVAQWYGLTPEDRQIGWLPLFHCGGDEPLYATLLTGGAVALFARVDIEAALAVIERERLTWGLFLPGIITDFLNHPRRDEYDLSSLRFGIGYANMMPGVVTAFCASIGEFWDAFGQTETSFVVAHGRVPRGAEPSLRKTPAPLMEIAIVDEALRECPVGTPGECVVRGPSVMSGYLDDPAATAEAFGGGWLHTGDVLVEHPDGTLSYVDRSKYLIKTGGENVYPAEVEQAITAHPAVQEVCVLGVADDRWGETIKAVVVVAAGATVTAPELVAWCRERLAGYKRPRYVEFLAADEMPRSTTGKLLRHELAQRPVDDAQRVD